MREREELVAAAQAGDREALGELLDEHRPLVLATCRRMIDDPILAEEAFQEASLVVLLNLPALRRRDRFGPWLTGIALNVCRHLLRDRRRERLFAEHPAGGGDVEGDAMAALEATSVRDAIAALPTGQREAVLHFYIGGMTHAEVAARLGIGVGAVKTRLHRARAALRVRLSQEEARSMTDRMPGRTVQMTVAAIRRLRRQGRGEYHVLVLSELGGARTLPVWIGPTEATSIALQLERPQGLRPTTAAFAANLLRAAGGTVREVRIERLAGSVYLAVAVVEGPGGVMEVDARPSDAINVALLTDSPIMVGEAVLARSEELRATETAPLAFDEVAGATEITADAVARARDVAVLHLPPELRRNAEP